MPRQPTAPSSASRVATVVANEQCDAVEPCLRGGAGVLFVRELPAAGRRDTNIVVHRGQ
jgi:hypothetical protein